MEIEFKFGKNLAQFSENEKNGERFTNLLKNFDIIGSECGRMSIQEEINDFLTLSKLILDFFLKENSIDESECAINNVIFFVENLSF